jgi:hypothetical protein
MICSSWRKPAFFSDLILYLLRLSMPVRVVSGLVPPPLRMMTSRARKGVTTEFVSKDDPVWNVYPFANISASLTISVSIFNAY